MKIHLTGYPFMIIHVGMIFLCTKVVSGFGAFNPDTGDGGGKAVNKELTAVEKCMLPPLYVYVYYFPKNETTVNWESFYEAFEKEFGNMGNATFQLVHKAFGQIHILQWNHTLETEEEYIEVTNILEKSHLHIYDASVLMVEISAVESPKTIMELPMQHNYFSNGRICYSPSRLYLDAGGKFTENCQYRFPDSTTTIERQNLRLSITYADDSWPREEFVTHCTEYYFSEDCPSGITMDISGNIDYNDQVVLTIMKPDNTSSQLNATQFLPLGDGKYRICYESLYDAPNLDQQKPSFHQYTWKTILDEVDFYTSTCLSVLSLIFEVLFVAVFHQLKDMQYQSYHNLAILNFLLLLADALSITSSIVKQATHWIKALKALAIIQHFSFLSVNTWSALLSVDLVKKTRYNRGQVDNTKSRFHKWNKLTICLLVNFLLTAVCIGVDQSKAYEFQYGESRGNKAFWIKNHYPRIFFYLLPTAICYMMALCFMVVACVRLNQKREDASSQSEERNAIYPNLRSTLSTTFKIITILVIPEIFGSVQLYKSHLNESEAILNATFAFICSLGRSVRGMLTFLVCFCNRKTWSLYRRRRNFIHQQKTKENREVSGLSK